jgi:hypothetical protein
VLSDSPNKHNNSLLNDAIGSDHSESIPSSTTEDSHQKAKLITDLFVNKNPHTSSSSMISSPINL